MLVGPDGEAVGSVSGGCVEGAVYELGEQVRDDGRPVLQRYGVSDDDAFAVGLTCGGIIDLSVETVHRHAFPQRGDVAEAIAKEQPVAVATVVAGPPERLGGRLVVWPDRVDGTTGSARLDDALRDDVRGLLDAGRNATLHYGVDGEAVGRAVGVGGPDRVAVDRRAGEAGHRRRRADVDGRHPVQRLGQPDVLDGGPPRRAEPGQRLPDRLRGEELSTHRSGWPSAPPGRGCSPAAAPPLLSPRTLSTGPSATWPSPQMEVLRMASSSRTICVRRSSSSSEPDS